MNGIDSRMRIEDFESLTTDQKLNVLYGAIQGMQDKYAGKWVEIWTIRGLATVVIGFLGSIMYVIGWHQTPHP